jgi:hypothetical protein
LASHQKGTCEAFLKSTEMISWIEGSNLRLWCVGIRMSLPSPFPRLACLFANHWNSKLDLAKPCSRKLGHHQIQWCLANDIARAVLLDSLQATCAANPNVGVAAMFCNYKEPQAHTTVNLIAALWRQLAYKSDLTTNALELYARNAAQGTRPSLDETYNVFRSELDRYSKVYIVVDALDELDELEQNFLLEKLCQCPKVNIFITSRLKPGGKWSGNFQLAEISPRQEDIRLYLSERITTQPRIRAHVANDAALHEEIVSSIESHAGGM